MTKLAVFDCDGTLVDGQAAICETMEQAFEAAGLPLPDRNAVRRMVGLSLPQALDRLAPDADSHRRAGVVDAYKSLYRERRVSGRLEEPLYEGIKPLIERLHASGLKLAVATGKSDRGLSACLASHNLTDRFISLQTADRHPSKPHPSMLAEAMADAEALPAETVMIGDTSYDMEMAVAAGTRAIGVAWGYHDPEELVAAGADGVAHSMEDLEAMIRGQS